MEKDALFYLDLIKDKNPYLKINDHNHSHKITIYSFDVFFVAEITNKNKFLLVGLKSNNPPQDSKKSGFFSFYNFPMIAHSEDGPSYFYINDNISPIYFINGDIVDKEFVHRKILKKKIGSL